MVNLYDVKTIDTRDSLDQYINFHEAEIKKEKERLEMFKVKAEERLKEIDEYENNKQYVILGHTHKDGREKGIMFIMRFPNGAQRTKRYYYESIVDMRSKLAELREIHNGVDWSEFKEEIK
jgi:superfamily II DNA or RNA helicase